MFLKIVRNDHVGIYEGSQILFSYPLIFLNGEDVKHLQVVVEPSNIEIIIREKEENADEQASVYLMNDNGKTVEKIL